jgi:tetratricopeptide (TPR) repeat protein
LIQMYPGRARRMMVLPDEKGIETLVRIVGEERYFEPRLTGGFKHGPLRQVMRGPNDLSKQDLRLLAAAAELQKAAEREPSAENLHAFGVALILLGGDDLDRGLDALRASVGVRETAEVLTDLGVGYLERFRAARAPDDLANAVASIERALQLAPSLAPALYNRAICLRLTGRVVDAEAAWSDYLSRYPEGPWASEASRELSSLRPDRSVK